MPTIRGGEIVRFRSSKGKYLQAKEDNESVIQHEDMLSPNVLWRIEQSPDHDKSLFQLKSCFGTYLARMGTATIHTLPDQVDRQSLDWQIIELKSITVSSGKTNVMLISSNNHVLHGGREDCVEIQVVEGVKIEHGSFISVQEKIVEYFWDVEYLNKEGAKAKRLIQRKSAAYDEHSLRYISSTYRDGSIVKMRNHVGMYLYAKEDGDIIMQHPDGSSKNVQWRIEQVPNRDRGLFQFKSCYGTYLARVGNSVIQTLSRAQIFDWEIFELVQDKAVTTSNSVPTARVVLRSPRFYVLQGGDTDIVKIKVTKGNSVDDLELVLQDDIIWDLECVKTSDQNDKFRKLVEKDRDLFSSSKIPNPLQREPLQQKQQEQPQRQERSPATPASNVVSQYKPSHHIVDELDYVNLSYKYPTKYVSPQAQRPLSRPLIPPNLNNLMRFQPSIQNLVLNNFYPGRDAIYANSGFNTNLSGPQSNGSVDAQTTIRRPRRSGYGWTF